MNQATRDAQTLLGMSREITGLREEIARLNADLERAEKAVEDRDAKLSEVQSSHDRMVEAIFSFMPECWDSSTDDQAAVDFVASLLDQGEGSPGHTADCACWSG
jgi:hypothetical protein